MAEKTAEEIMNEKREEDNELYNVIQYDFKNKLTALDYFVKTNENRTIGMFDYGDKLPETVPEDEYEKIVQNDGAGLLIRWPREDGEFYVVQANGVPPYDVNRMPKFYLVNNPWIDCINEKFEVGVDCVLIKNDPWMLGMKIILEKNGSLMLEGDLTLKMALVNFRAAFVATSDDDDTDESMRIFFEKLEAGDFSVIHDSTMSGKIGMNPMLSNASGYLTQAIEALQYIRGSFFNDIGLNANYNMKRERQTENEAGLNEDILRTLPDAMLEERVKAWKKAFEIWGDAIGDVKVKFGSSWSQYNKEEVEDVEEVQDLKTEAEEVQEEPEAEETEEVVEETETEEIDSVEDQPEESEETEDSEGNEEESEETEEKSDAEVVAEVVEDIKEIVETVVDAVTESEPVAIEEEEEKDDEETDSEKDDADSED